MVSISRQAVSDKSGLQSGGGKCPSCQTRISALQAGFKGTRRPFECAGCGQQIQKVNSEALLAFGAFTSLWFIKQRTESFWVVAIAFILICVSIIMKSRYRSQIALVDIDQSDASQNESMSEQN